MMRHLRKSLKAALVLQVGISFIILIPIFYAATKGFIHSASLTEEERKEEIYGGFYRSLKEYVTQIPLSDNAAIIEPPGERAELFWILNYYFLPRHVYTFPDSSFLNTRVIQRYNIKFLIRTTKTGFYFETL
jgi:hypothetical protein